MFVDFNQMNYSIINYNFDHMKKSVILIVLILLFQTTLFVACEEKNYDFPNPDFSDCSPDKEVTIHTKIIGNIFGSTDNYEFIIKDIRLSKKIARFGLKICNTFYDKSLVNQQADLLCTLEIEKNIPENRWTKTSIKSIINLDENPNLDPRYKGDGEKVVVYSKSNQFVSDTTFFGKIFLINSQSDLEKYKLKTKIPFDFSRYSLIGRVIGIGGCSSDFALNTTVFKNKTSVNVTAYSIGECRAIDFYLMFVKVPKITNYNNLSLNIDYK
jgi:hypothetical protein